MQDRETKREKFNYYNSLTGLVKALEGHHTVIDLRNESCVSGLISRVDGYMNVEMEDVIFYDPRGQPHHFKEFCVQSRNIRYVHIPDGVDAMAEYRQLVDRYTGRLKREQPKRPNFKVRRAQRYQQEIMQDIARQQQGQDLEDAAGTSH